MKALAPMCFCLCLTSVLLVSCAASDERIQDDFAVFVSDRDSCEVAADCTMDSYGCPLGCGVAFNKKYEDEVADEAERLIKKYERGGRACAYKCTDLGEAVCEAGTCSIDGSEAEGEESE